MIVEKICPDHDTDRAVVFFKDTKKILYEKVPSYPEDTVLEWGVDHLLHVSGSTDPNLVDGVSVLQSFDMFFSENPNLSLEKVNSLLEIAVHTKEHMYRVWMKNAYAMLNYKKQDESDILTTQDICMTFNPSTFDECAQEIKTLSMITLDEMKQSTGSFYFTLYSVYQKVNRTLRKYGKEISFREYSAFIHSDADTFYLSAEILDADTKVALQEDYEKESQVYYWLKGRLNKPTPFPKYHADDVEGLCEEQITAVQNIMLENGCATILTGGPGTGKTTILKRIVTALKQEYPNEKIAMLAPTGKAAKRIKETMGDMDVSVSTIHKFIGYTGENVNYVLPKVIKNIKSTHCIMIDESSMLGSILFATLLGYVDLERTKIILVGDIHQLPSVDTGALLRDLIRIGIPVYELTENHRSADATTIVDNSKIINAGEKDLVYNEQFILTYEDIYKQLDRIMQEENSIILSPYQTPNKSISTFNINAYVHNRIHSEERTHFYTGERVIITHTEYRMGVPVYIKGETGVIRRPEVNSDGTYSYIVQTAPEKELIVPECHLDYGYALTIHKSQGSEYDTVYIPLPEANDFITKKMLYTAVTRAKKRVVLFSTSQVISATIDNNNDDHRNTFLQDLSFADEE